jgi:hypothetical protein
VPRVGVVGDQIAASPVGLWIQIGGGVEIEHALAVEVHEREPVTGVAVVVGVDADTETSLLVEGHGFGHVADRKCRCRGHPDSSYERFEADTTQLDVVARPERDGRLVLAAARAGHWARSSFSTFRTRLGIGPDARTASPQAPPSFDAGSPACGGPGPVCTGNTHPPRGVPPIARGWPAQCGHRSTSNRWDRPGVRGRRSQPMSEPSSESPIAGFIGHRASWSSRSGHQSIEPRSEPTVG